MNVTTPPPVSMIQTQRVAALRFSGLPGESDIYAAADKPGSDSPLNKQYEGGFSGDDVFFELTGLAQAKYDLTRVLRKTTGISIVSREFVTTQLSADFAVRKYLEKHTQESSTPVEEIRDRVKTSLDSVLSDFEDAGMIRIINVFGKPFIRLNFVLNDRR